MDGVTRKIVLFSVLVALISVANCTIPDFIEVCPRAHQNLSACIINSIEKIRPRLIAGIEELGVPSMDPLNLDQLIIDRIASGSRLATNLTNVVVHGGWEFQILKLIPTIRKRGYTFRFEVIIPKLFLEGNYELDSQILFLDLVGKGPFTANITDYHFECILKGNQVKRDGDNYLEFERLKCNAVLRKTNLLLENLFNGNPVYGPAVNGIINDNSDIFIAEISPPIGEVLLTKFTDIANRITATFKYEEFFS